MNAQVKALEAVTWDVSMVDAEVKLYLLALIRADGDEETAQRLSGLDEHAARLARGWLQEAGALGPDGQLNEAVLHEARNTRLHVVPA